MYRLLVDGLGRFWMKFHGSLVLEGDRRMFASPEAST